MIADAITPKVEVKEYVETMKRLTEVLRYLDDEIVDIKKRLDKLEIRNTGK